MTSDALINSPLGVLAVLLAAIVAAEGVAGVKAVEDGLMLVDNWSGFYLTPPDAEPGAAAKGG